MRVIFDADDHARVTRAVADAERGTLGEVVTVVARRSDEYRDVLLHWAIAAMLAVPVAVGVIPGAAHALANWHARGWADAYDLPWLLLLVVLGQAAAFVAVQFALAPWRVALAPKATRARRVRRRAIALFRAAAEDRTPDRVGVLLYLSLDEHDAEIVADAAIHAAVPEERWGEAMAALVDRARAGDPAGGMAAAVEAIGAILREALPCADDGGGNRLPDRLIEL